MTEEDKRYWMDKLIDYFGFSYKKSEEILKQDNSLFIISCIVDAHSKGVGTPTYKYSGGL